jgi:hypothetical protein
MYGCVVYACLCNTETTLDQSNTVFAQAEVFLRKMMRWIFMLPNDTRKSLMYVLSN